MLVFPDRSDYRQTAALYRFYINGCRRFRWSKIRIKLGQICNFYISRLYKTTYKLGKPFLLFR